MPFINDTALAATDSLRRELLRSARGDVLDLGFGTGLNAQHYGGARRVFAVEPADPMWRRGATRAAEAGLRIDRIVGYGESLPLADASVDVAVCTFVLCSVRDPERVLAELARVVRPDGQLLVLEHVKSPDSFTASAQRWVTPAWKLCLDGCNPGRDLAATLASSAWSPLEARAVRLPRVPFLVKHGLFARYALAKSLS